ncbi:MAG: hypothetical protein J6B09_03415 [Clostridia bacterium]|nr:hypothetical protein [Clostridia bacterium]
MITVKPIQSKEDQERLCALCQIPYRAELLAYGAYNGQGAFAGMCQFGMDAEGGHIYHLATKGNDDPDDCLFVMGRAALNFIDLCGVKIAFFDGECEDSALLRRIGFSADEKGRFTLSLDGFFTHACQHHPQ